MSQVTDPELSRGGIDPARIRRIRVRYAPSPTGIPHIGNIRTALFNYLFAKNQKGTFILRIEDTDQKRLVPNAVEKIRESLSILSLDPDEEYHQSKRLDVYKKHLEILIKNGLAYEEENAWRFKVEKGKNLNWKDVVHGEISFSADVIEDFIIIKSDGYPTYHFASVVDDHDMQISHVFRGDEWISSTPKHLLLYESFGWDPPQFVHMPPILGANKKKLSKRDGAKSVMEYIEEGYLPEAITNFMAFLGWAPKNNQEIFSLEELIKEFSIERINKNSPIFNLQKLNWFNSQWIRKIDAHELAKRIHEKFPKFELNKIIDNLPLVRERLSSLDDFPKLTSFLLLEDKIKVDASKVILPAVDLSKIVNEYKPIQSQWTKANIGNATISVIERENLSKPQTLNSIGTAVSGSTVTPPIYDSLEKLGFDKTISRIEDVIKKKENRG